jgi:hypothetical protein
MYRTVGRSRGIGLVLAVLAAALVAPRPAHATPSGLNNIPSADVVPKDILVVQSWTEVGPDGDTSWAAGLKVGPAENWELGLDGGLAGPGSGGGPTFQAKYRIPLQNGARAALGLANVSNDRDRHGGVLPLRGGLRAAR